MILIYAPYPNQSEIKDGWMGRISVIDKIFADRPRRYVFPGSALNSGSPKDYRVADVQVEEHVWMWWADLRFALHWRYLTELVESCDFVYAHTCHSSQVLLPYYKTGKIITDIHGIAPEEEELQGRPNNARFFGAFEESMVRESAALVTVTESMGDHYRKKYPGLDTPMIDLPIVDDKFAGTPLERPMRERLRVVYAGGAQSWQNVDLMFEIVGKCGDRFEFTFYSQDTAAMKDAASRHGVTDRVTITSCSMDRLSEVYGAADLGFVLRDDIAVNRVACPTKLSEYLATGVIPIVKLHEIGDFARLGYEYITVDELVSGEPLNQARFNDSRKKNRAVFDAIGDKHESGKLTLRDLPNPVPRLNMREARSLFLTPIERAVVFPIRGAELIYTRGSSKTSKSLGDLTHPEKELEIDIEGDGPLQSFQFAPLERPFVTTPMIVHVITTTGEEHLVKLSGNYRHDLFGNWFFDRGRPMVSARRLNVPDACTLRIRFEFVLYGPEATFAERSRLGRMLPGGAKR